MGGSSFARMILPRDAERASEVRGSDVRVVLARAAAPAVPEVPDYRFSSQRRGLRTKTEAQGRAEDIPRSPFWGQDDARGLPTSPTLIGSNSRPLF